MVAAPQVSPVSAEGVDEQERGSAGGLCGGDPGYAGAGDWCRSGIQQNPKQFSLGK